jgi:hypothetical protein
MLWLKASTAQKQCGTGTKANTMWSDTLIWQVVYSWPSVSAGSACMDSTNLWQKNFFVKTGSVCTEHIQTAGHYSLHNTVR